MAKRKPECADEQQIPEDPVAFECELLRGRIRSLIIQIEHWKERHRLQKEIGDLHAGRARRAEKMVDEMNGGSLKLGE